MGIIFENDVGFIYLCNGCCVGRRGGGGESGNYIYVVFVFSKVVNFCVISLYYF